MCKNKAKFIINYFESNRLIIHTANLILSERRGPTHFEGLMSLCRMFFSWM